MLPTLEAETVTAHWRTQQKSVGIIDWLEGGATSPTMNGCATPADCRDTEQLKAPPSNGKLNDGCRERGHNPEKGNENAN